MLLLQRRPALLAAPCLRLRGLPLCPLQSCRPSAPRRCSDSSPARALALRAWRVERRASCPRPAPARVLSLCLPRAPASAGASRAAAGLGRSRSARLCTAPLVTTRLRLSSPQHPTSSLPRRWRRCSLPCGLAAILIRFDTTRLPRCRCCCCSSSLSSPRFKWRRCPPAAACWRGGRRLLGSGTRPSYAAAAACSGWHSGSASATSFWAELKLARLLLHQPAGGVGSGVPFGLAFFRSGSPFAWLSPGSAVCCALLPLLLRLPSCSCSSFAGRRFVSSAVHHCQAVSLAFSSGCGGHTLQYRSQRWRTGQRCLLLLLGAAPSWLLL